MKRTNTYNSPRVLTGTRIQRGLGLCGMVLALTGCGGGGSGSSGTIPSNGGTQPGATTPDSLLTFVPASVIVEAYAGESRRFEVTATINNAFSEAVNVAIVDKVGVIKPSAEFFRTSLGYSFTGETSASLAPGLYEGAFEVRLCRDTPTICASPYPGSPSKVPYKITVRPATNLTPLSALAGATAWSTYQGNATHTGFVDASISATAFNRRWAKAVDPGTIGSIVADGGRVVIAPPGNAIGALRALSEDNGSELWRFAGEQFYSGLALGQGTVWFSNYQQMYSTATLYGINAANGQVRVSTAMAGDQQGSRYGAVLFDGSVFVPVGSSSVLARYDATTGARQWSTILGYPYSLSVDNWSPAVVADQAYVYDYKQLWIANANTGAEIGSIPGPNNSGLSSYWDTKGAPVPGPGGLVYVTAYGDHSTGRLVAFDVIARNVRWTVGTTVHSNPVLANGTVYVVDSSGGLQAYNALTGAPIWRWDSPAGLSVRDLNPNAPLLVVGSYAFVSVGGMTYAIDLNTRQTAWQYPLAGRLAVSPQGILYIGGNSQLAAFNLR